MSSKSVMSTRSVDKEDNTGPPAIWQAPWQGQFSSAVDSRTGMRLAYPALLSALAPHPGRHPLRGYPAPRVGRWEPIRNDAKAPSLCAQGRVPGAGCPLGVAWRGGWDEGFLRGRGVRASTRLLRSSPPLTPSPPLPSSPSSPASIPPWLTRHGSTVTRRLPDPFRAHRLGATPPSPVSDGPGTREAGTRLG
jgi:hypothetical protein